MGMRIHGLEPWLGYLVKIFGKAFPGFLFGSSLKSMREFAISQANFSFLCLVTIGLLSVDAFISFLTQYGVGWRSGPFPFAGPLLSSLTFYPVCIRAHFILNVIQSKACVAPLGL